MDCLSFLVGPVVNVFKNLWTNFITEKLSNFTSSAKRVEEMEKKMKDLERKRDDIKEHMNDNEINNRKIPRRVPLWLDEVEKIKKDFDNIPSNTDCFNLKKKYEAGEDALKLTEKIDDLITQSKEITWTNAQIPLGRVDSKRPPSTSTSGGDTQNVFDSRVKTFNDALKLLQHDGGKTRVIALCGMGGVGKTTLMKQLKEAAEDNKMFKWIVVVVVGKSSNLFKIQNAIAAYTGGPLTETDETLRATLLSKRFQAFSERKEKSLVILDDVWEKIKLEDIGLASPLPNGVKLLLTSRDVKVCRQIAAIEVVKVDVLKENEARDFFCQIAGISAEHDCDLYEIGCEIVKKCGYLPLAIEIIAGTLKCEEDRGVWRYRLDRLKMNDLDENVQEIIEISYKSLKREEDKAIFLLCGLFPEDSNIPIEDLTRYAWGLKLLKQVFTMGKARDSIQTSVSNLKNAYMLMDGDSHQSDCVKMHDLVLAFAVGTVSKGGKDGCWIIHHEDDFSKLSEANNMSQSCKQLSLTCKGMPEFPSEFQFPNLSLLKLMLGNESLRFPRGFYEVMEKLQVIAFEKLEYPPVPALFQCSANLRTLCLHECSLMFDLACIGNLSNMEVLSFANSAVTILPSTFRNLKKLRLLDVTGCYNLVIDHGILGGLVKLEELYMIPYGETACCFTVNNFSELAERSEHLSALEFEFIGNNAYLKNMSYVKLQRFKLSVGCYFTEDRWLHRSQGETHSYQNSLKLVTNREEILKSKINELFKITHALYLQVNDMNTLEDFDVESPHPPHPRRYSSFRNLRVLVVSECAELKYLFTPSDATSLSKLEYLEISGCLKMEAIIHTENYVDAFSNLKYLRLAKLPELLHFCNKVDVIELPRVMELQLEGLPKITSIYWSSDISSMQSLFNKEDTTPKLEKLVLVDMENLKEIWPPQLSICNLCPLRELTVKNMDFGEIEQLSSSLRSITVDGCNSLVKLFSCNPFPFFNNLQELEVRRCCSIKVLFDIDSGRTGNIGEQVCTSSLRSIEVKECDSLVNIFSCNPFPFFNNLQELEVRSCRSIQVLFEIDSGPAGRYEEQDAAPKLEKLVVFFMENLKEIWPPQFSISNLCPLRELTVVGCGSIEVLFNMDFGEIEQLSSSLRSITVERCDSLVKLFSCNPFPFMNNLQELRVTWCGSIQVLFNTDLGRADKSAEQVCSSSLRSIKVSRCDSLVNLLPRNPMPLFNHLEELQVFDCASVEVIFDIDMGCVGEMDKVSSSRLRSIHLEKLGKLREVWRIKDAGKMLEIHGFEAVESIFIRDCERFENLITPATTTFDMRALKEVYILRCGRESERKDELVESNQDLEIDVVSTPGKESNDDIPKVALPSYLLHTFHHLHKLALDDYKGVEVVFEIMNPSTREPAHNTQQPLILPYLEELRLYDLERMSHVWKCNWNEFLHLPKQQSQSSFHNLTTITMYHCSSINYLFSPLMAKLLSSLKKIDIKSCDGIEEVVSNRDDEDASIYSHTATTFFHHLDILKLERLRNLKCIGGGANGISTDIHDELKSSQASWSWSLCQYARQIRIRDCDSLSNVIPWYVVGQMQKLHVLKIQGCNLLEHIFTFSTLESLTQLEELEVKDCKAVEVIVKKESGELTTTSAVFPHLKSLILFDLPNLVGFFLGTNEFIWQALEKVVIGECPQITVFTYGQSTAPKLKFINTSLGKHSVECGLNFHVTTTSHQAQLPSYESTSSYRPTTMERSYHNLIEADMVNTSGGQILFSSDKLLQLQKLETVHCRQCRDIEQIFDSQTDAEIPNLRQVDLEWLSSLKYIWKSKQGTILKFPNLTRLSIEWCDSLEYVFTCPMVGSLLQLQELHIRNCRSMKVIVKGEEEECDAIVNASVVFPGLKSLKLHELRSLEGFCIGKEAFEFPSLDTLEIYRCAKVMVFTNGDLSTPSLDTLQIDWCYKMRVFTKGDLYAPKLYAISRGGRKYYIHNRLNSVIESFIGKMLKPKVIRNFT